MGAAEFEVMKDGVIFINASRGTVVDIDALSEALASKKVAGAAIDVFPVEPKAMMKSSSAHYVPSIT